MIDAADPLAQAHLRLAQSRLRLLDALGGTRATGPGERAPGTSERPTGPLRATAARSNPNSMLNLALDVCNGALEPMASRHPWRLVLGAASVGAAVTVARPWRWAPQAMVAAGVLRPWLQTLLLGAATRMALARLASPVATAPVQPIRRP
jgi:hypothetical protein